MPFTKVQKTFVKGVDKSETQCYTVKAVRRDGNLKVSVDRDEGPPVPISNTEVKLVGAEDTCLATDRENRLMLTFNIPP